MLPPSDVRGSSYKHALGFRLPGRPLGPPMVTSTGRRTTMSSRRTATAALVVGIVLAFVGAARAEQDHATPQEVVQKVRQAAEDIAKQGEAGLATYRSKNDTSVWKDSYV